MKCVIVLAVLMLCTVSFLAGCDGMASSFPERRRRIKNANEIYARQMVDDLDQIFLYDRVCYLTEWPIRDTDD